MDRNKTALTKHIKYVLKKETAMLLTMMVIMSMLLRCSGDGGMLGKG